METSTKILCGICDAQHVTTYADFWCPECDDGLCTECNSHHSFSKASRHHDVISIENYRKLPTDILSIVHHCTEHEKKFHIFCPHHDQLCCHLCLSTGHKECTGMLSIEEIAKTSKSSGLLETLQKSLEDLKSNIDNVVKDRQSNLIKIKEEQQNILAGIQNLRKRINSHFDKLEQEIVEELNAAELDMKMKIEDLFKELREKSERIAVLQTNISDLENYASDFQTFVGSKKIEKEIESEETYIQSLTKDERLKQVSLKYSNNEEIENVFQSITSFGLISKESGSPCIEIKLEKNKQAQILTTSFIPKSVDNTVSAPMVDTEEMDPELARYLNRNYWQQKSEIKTTNVPTTTPSAPVVTTEQKATEGGKVVIEAYQNGENEDDEEQFLKALQSSLEIFVNRMRSNSQRGRSIATDSSVQSLFNVISNMHPQLMKYVGKQEDLRGNYEALQDKLAQLRDAREALDALREDHREKRRRELEEMERQRQIQMAHKLEIMRQKKHEYLEMQRQLALQRLQEQEREMQMRLEQQKHMTQIRQMQNYGYPQFKG